MSDDPVSREDFERAMRHLNLADLELRDAVLRLGARLVALTDELTRRVDGVEPEPAPPGTAAPPSGHTVEAAVAQHVQETYQQVLVDDARRPWRVALDLGPSKYDVVPSTPPCDELMPLCQARCCTLHFDLSTIDLDEGVIRWDYGQPYLIRQRPEDGYCVHNDPTTRHCTEHAHRPRVCRTYDCREDTRIWIDYENRVLAPPEAAKVQPASPPPDEFDLIERARARAEAIANEHRAIYRLLRVSQEE